MSKALALLLCLWVSTVSLRSQGRARLRGEVKDQSSAPILNAKIVLLSLDGVFETRSLRDGSFELHSIPPGDYDVDIKADGFKRQKLNINLRENEVNVLPPVEVRVGNMPDMDTCGNHPAVRYIRKNSQTPSAFGVLQNYASKKAISKAEVTLSMSNGNHASQTSKTDQSGKFAFPELAPAYYDLRISRAGYQSLEEKHILVPRRNAIVLDAALVKGRGFIVCQ